MTNQPSREFRRHHDVEAPQVDADARRPFWRVRTRLDQLLADFRISRAEWQAAVEFRDAWGRALAVSRVGELRLVAAAGGGNPHDRLLNLVASVERLAAVKAALGELRTALLIASVVEDLSWAAIARQCQRNPETVRDWTVAAIQSLARAWPQSPPERATGRSSDHSATPSYPHRRTAL